jgi:hypothetical protein
VLIRSGGRQHCIGLTGEARRFLKATWQWQDSKFSPSSQYIHPRTYVITSYRDFKTIASSSHFPAGLCKTTFLAITPNSTTSFSDARPGDRKGGYRGFLHAVAADFDPPLHNPPRPQPHPECQYLKSRRLAIMDNSRS